MLTADLTGPLLDAYVAKAIELKNVVPTRLSTGKMAPCIENANGTYTLWHPSSNWGQGGPLIDTYNMSLLYLVNQPHAPRAAHIHKHGHGWKSTGAHTLTVLCRAIVLARFGNEVMSILEYE